MLRRLLPLALVSATLVLDSAGVRQLAFYALLVAIPFAAARALDLFGELVELPGGASGEALARAEAAAAFLGLVLVVAAAASRAPAAIAPIGDSAVVGAGLLFTLALVVGAARATRPQPEARRVADPEAGALARAA